ncbi:MAG: hypothetical protein KDD50_08660 [Bdellovibrionales bacterium]|nr:hypothetical protein [Bdellovibrionales bacterium]
MSNVIIIDKDERLARQAAQYIKEIDDSNLFNVFAGDKAFYDKYFRGNTDSDTVDDERVKNDHRLSTIDLVIFSIDSVQSKPIEFIQQTLDYIKKFRYTLEDQQPRFVITKYEDDGFNKIKLMHPLVDDVIYQPYDRLLFLQKIDIILTLPEKATPRFLFSENVDFDIEISKRTSIHGLSNIGFSIINPNPLSKNMVAHFYLQLPSASNDTIDFHGQVIENEPHEDGSRFIVYFSYFGMPRDSLLALKKFLKDKNYKPLIDNDPKHFELSDLNIFATEEEKATRQILVIEPDNTTCASISNILTNEMSCNKVSIEYSYRDFLNKYFAKKKITYNDQIPFAELLDMTLGSIQFTVDETTLNLEKVGGLYDNSQKILDRGLEDFFSDPLAWKKLFDHEENDGLLEDAIKVVSGGHAFHKLFCVESLAGEQKLFSASFYQQKGHKEIDIKINAPNDSILKEIEEMNRRSPRLTKIDVLIINFKMIPSDFDSWYENLNEGARNRGLLNQNKKIKVIVIGEKSYEKAYYFSKKPIRGLLNSPINAHELAINISIVTNNSFTLYCLKNTHWLDTKAYVFVAKSAILETISEFGSTIQLPSPIAPGTSLFLHGSIFAEAPNRSLAARFYHSEPHESEKNKFSCSVIYFGINESFLKYARNWIRENYASKKNTPES